MEQPFSDSVTSHSAYKICINRTNSCFTIHFDFVCIFIFFLMKIVDFEKNGTVYNETRDITGCSKLTGR